VLAWYRPDASAQVRRHQQDFVARIGEACRRYDICFVFELLVYPLAGEAHQTQDYVEHRDKHPEMVLDSLRDFVDPRYGVDLFKLESPVQAAAIPDPADRDASEVRRTQALFDEIGEIATRPWVMLSAGADKIRFQRILTFAYRSGASGYLAGRAIWWQAFQHFPDLERFAQGLRGEAAAYMAEINGLTDREATAWDSHACFAEGVHLAGAGPEFRQRYPRHDPRSAHRRRRPGPADLRRALRRSGGRGSLRNPGALGRRSHRSTPALVRRPGGRGGHRRPRR
jgi:tagatose 1,6-diphosphate aldolase